MSKQKQKTAKQNLEHVYFTEFKPQTKNQHEYIRSIAENDITIVEGPAGTGKTFLAIGMACQYLLQGKLLKVLVSRSIIGCDNELGFFPGDVQEKVAPYMIPYIDYFRYFIGPDKTDKLLHFNELVLYPVELLRGHTYNNTMMILDEASNCTERQVKMFLTRMGKGSKVIMIGDSAQSDIGRNGFDFCVNNMDNLQGLGLVRLNRSDILRHPIIPHILEVFERKNI